RVACIGCDPVHFPRLAAISRESLLEVTRGRSDVRDHEAHQDRFAIEGFLVDELAPAVLEATDRGYAQSTARAVGEIEAPLAGVRVVQAQGQGLDVTGRPVDVKLYEVGAAVPDFSHDGGAVVFDPVRGAGQGMHEALQVRLPGADLEIEVMLTVPLGWRHWW